MALQVTIGTQITIYGEFRDEDGVLTDPSTVKSQIRTPAGTETEISNTNESTGVFSATYTPTVAGTYVYRWHSTGPTCVTEDVFFALPTSFTAPI